MNLYDVLIWTYKGDFGGRRRVETTYITSTNTCLCYMDHHIMGVFEDGFGPVFNDHIFDVAQDK